MSKKTTHKPASTPANKEFDPKDAAQRLFNEVMECPEEQRSHVVVLFRELLVKACIATNQQIDQAYRNSNALHQAAMLEHKL